MSEQLSAFPCQPIDHQSLAENIIELKLTRPANFSWQAGDYLWLGADDDNFKPFSIASQPDEAHIRLQIALVPAIQAWLTHLQEAAKLVIKGPVTQYQWPSGGNPIVLFAGGTGITPLLSLLLAHQDALAHRKVTLYWGVRQSRYLFAQQALNQLAQQYANFNWHAIISEPDAQWTGKTGLMPVALTDDQLNLANTNILICGPWPMVQSLKTWATEQGVSPDKMQ